MLYSGVFKTNPVSTIFYTDTTHIGQDFYKLLLFKSQLDRKRDRHLISNPDNYYTQVIATGTEWKEAISEVHGDSFLSSQ